MPVPNRHIGQGNDFPSGRLGYKGAESSAKRQTVAPHRQMQAPNRAVPLAYVNLERQGIGSPD